MGYEPLITDLGSAALPPERQGEVAHRYLLGLYSVLERLTTSFPDVLIRAAAVAAVGLTRDAPLLSANLDERLLGCRRENVYSDGISLVYPFSTMGAHVSVVPNHQTSRVTSLETRGNIAMVGQFGYELDITKLTEDELCEVKLQIEKYKSLERILHEGEFYRLKSPYDSNFTAWEFIPEDKNTVVLCLARIYSRAFQPHTLIKLSELDGSALYRERITDKVFSGSVLTEIGFNPNIYLKEKGDYVSRIFILIS